jgi:hypothetical protein
MTCLREDDADGTLALGIGINSLPVDILLLIAAHAR